MPDSNGQSVRIERNEEDIKELWSAVNEIKKMMVYRLPLWAVFIMSALTGLCGWLLRVATL